MARAAGTPVVSRARARKARSAGPKTCPQCNEVKLLEDFPRNASKASGRGSYCKPCQNARNTERGYGKRPWACAECGVERLTLVKHEGQRCRACYGKAQRHPDYDTRGPAAGRKRPPLPMPRLQVFERDEWTCGICHEGIDRTLAWPHDFCAVVDHVYPVASGGPNEPWNLQAAHNICNRIKGDKESAELYDQAMAQAPEEWFAQRAEVLAQSDLGRSILKEPW